MLSSMAGSAYASGLNYYYGSNGQTKDLTKAAQLFDQAAKRGHAGAQSMLGVMYATGQGGVAKDEREAARLYKLAADQGDAGAQFNLGNMYEDGQGGVAKDEREAARLYKLAADQGVAVAQFNLGFMYANDRGCLAKDEREAARLYKLAADQGHAAAQFGLGVMYANGQGGLAKDEREAARLYKLAADQGRADAQFNLGLMYANGQGGVAKDEREAVRLYKLAADQGRADAQCSLGIMYLNGQGCLAEEEREAARFFKLAADQGHAYAQFGLGVMYEQGLGGVAKDEREAARLYQLAADQGHDYAKKKMQDLGLAAAAPESSTQLLDFDPSATPGKFDVFLCHSGADKYPWVIQAFLYLHTLGFRCFFDRLTIEELRDDITTGLSASRMMVAFLSPSFFDGERSMWPQREVSTLVHHRDRTWVYPVFLMAPYSVRQLGVTVGGRRVGDVVSGMIGHEVPEAERAGPVFSVHGIKEMARDLRKRIENRDGPAAVRHILQPTDAQWDDLEDAMVAARNRILDRERDRLTRPELESVLERMARVKGLWK